MLVAPDLKLLAAVAQGDTGLPAADIFIRALLGGKKTTVLLDFEPPRFKRGTLFEKAADAADALRGMGADVIYLGAASEEGLKLIIEHEVSEAESRGIASIRSAPGAIITPLARDAAKDKGIAID